MIPKAIAVGMGVGIGSAQVYITDEFIGGFGTIVGNIGIGIASVLLGQYSKFNDDLKMALFAYGFTTIAGGILQGIPPPPGAAARNGRLGISPLTGDIAAVPLYQGGVRNGYYQNSFYRRPQTRAKGFGSDVTRNPMAAIPTRIPYNKIIF